MTELMVNPATPAASSPTNEEGVLVFPAAVAQQAFCFFDELDPGNPAFNVAIRFHLAGALDIPCLQRAFNEIVRRHESLRTHFEYVDGQLMQVVLPAAEVTL